MIRRTLQKRPATVDLKISTIVTIIQSPCSNLGVSGEDTNLSMPQCWIGHYAVIAGDVCGYDPTNDRIPLSGHPKFLFLAQSWSNLHHWHA
jgi:hypothetical protein